MARKAIVDRETVLQLLREGQTSKAIADRFGVSRQAIDLYRKYLSNFIPPNDIEKPQATNEPKPTSVYQPKVESVSGHEKPPYPTRTSTRSALSLDEMVDLIIEAFSALRRVKELESEISTLKKKSDALLQQIEQLEVREQKRKEQEARWIHAQSPGIMTLKPD
jgi:cell division protein FtsL